MAKTRETFCNTFFLELFVCLVSPITIFYEQFVKYVNYCLNQGLQSAQVCTYVFVYTENDLLHNIIIERTEVLRYQTKMQVVCPQMRSASSVFVVAACCHHLQFFLRKRFLGGSHQEWNVGRHFEGG